MTKFPFFLSLILPCIVFASPLPLTEREHAQLRYHLENLWNEVDLLTRNQKVNKADVLRQEREFALFQVFEKIPMEPRLADFKRQLTKSGARTGFRVKTLLWTGKSKSPSPIPRSVTTDIPFRLARDQVIQEIRFRTILSPEGTPLGPTDISKAFQELERLTELYPDSPRKLKSGLWEVRGKIFSFRDIRFPQLKPRNPLSLLPAPARGRLREFALREPLLWSFVTRIQENAPRAQPFYANRARFMLNDARMSFYLSVQPR